MSPCNRARNLGAYDYIVLHSLAEQPGALFSLSQDPRPKPDQLDPDAGIWLVNSITKKLKTMAGITRLILTRLFFNLYLSRTLKMH